MAFGDFLKTQLGFDSVGIPSNKKNNSPDLPWDNEPADTFFPVIDIDANKWNQLYPYKLLVVEINDKGGFDVVNGSNIQVATTHQKPKGQNGIEFIITQEPVSKQWSYTFPITPQQFSVTDQYAINTTATMRGVIEEHNGVKFKIIAMSGSTGVWPNKPVMAGVPKFPSTLAGFAGNSLQALGDVVKQAGKVQSAFTGDKSQGTAKTPEQLNLNSFTGYFQALLLSQFLERYALAKKNPANKNWRLVLDIPKESQSFIVTPMQFSLNKSQQKPNEYLWSLQLKAWKRIDMAESPYAKFEPLSLGTPNIMAKINATLRETRRTLSASLNLVQAVRSDFQAPLNALRQTALAVKDLGGLTYSVIDLPSSIINDYKSAIKSSANILKNSFKRDSTIQGANNGSGGGSSSTGVTAASINASSLESKAGNAINSIVNSNINSEGLSYDAVASGALGSDAVLNQQLDPINAIFANSDANFDFFDGIDVTSLTLTPEQQQAIDNEIQNAQLITQNDLNGFKAEILSLALDISNNFGAGDTTYASIYGRPTPKTRVNPMTIEENEILISLYEAIQAYDILTANKLFDDTKKQSPLSYVGGLAADAGIAFDDATSKYLVPVPFGLTIEQIAARYLGNPDKWIEITTLNYLRSPYIDEEGFEYSFLSNATDRQFNVNDSAQKLYIGQKIVLSSTTVPQFVRKISNIEKISDFNYLITVDGLADLDSLQTVNGAKMKGYLPGTINSQDQIYIPTNLPADADDRVKLPPAFRNDQLTKISKIDLLLTDNGDLAINGVGDFRLANGLNNLVQALKLKIRTKRGTLLRHLDFGLGIQHGVSIADIENGILMQELTRIVVQDSRFAGVDRLDITLNGATLTIDMAVRIANNSGIIPITFDV